MIIIKTIFFILQVFIIVITIDITVEFWSPKVIRIQSQENNSNEMWPLNFYCHIHGQFYFLSSFIFVMFAITILWQPDFNPKKSLKNLEESWPLRCDNSNLITACMGWIKVVSWCLQGLQPGPPWSWSMWWPNSNLRKKWKKKKRKTKQNWSQNVDKCFF